MPAAARFALAGEADFLALTDAFRDGHFVSFDAGPAVAPKGDLLLRAVQRFLERDEQVGLDVLPARLRPRETRPYCRRDCPAPRRPASGEELLEEIAEPGAAKARPAVAKSTAAASTAPAGRRLLPPALLPVRAESVVLLALIGIAQHLVGFVDLLELRLRPFLVLGNVGVMLAGELAEGFADLVVRRGLRDAEGGIVILVLHRHKFGRRYRRGGKAPAGAHRGSRIHAYFVRRGQFRAAIAKRMSSLLNFFTRDNRFFDLLEQSAVEAQNGATAIGKLMALMGEGPIETMIRDLDETRRKHKRISQEVTEALTKVFVTPIEREDIEALSSALYKITKNCEKIGDRIAICPPGSDLRSVTKQVGMLGQAGDVVAKMVHELRRKAHGEQVRDLYERLQTIEGEADRTMNEQLRDLIHAHRHRCAAGSLLEGHL